MMNIVAFIIIIIGLQLICLFVSKQAAKELKTEEDYFLAGRNLSFFPLTMTFIATQIGGGIILGSAEEAYRVGWSALFYPLGCILGLILLGLGLGKRLATFRISTIAQLFEVVYGSTKLKNLASLLSIISLFIILVAQVIASSKFMVSIGMENKILFFAFWGIVIFYTSFGGLKAVVATDIVQALFFISAFAICMIFILYTSEISMGEVLRKSTEIQVESISNFKLYAWILMPLLFMLIEQDMAQRCFSALSPKAVSKATLFAGIVTLVVSAFPIYLGILANQMGLEIESQSSVLMTVIEKVSTPFLSALVGAAILVAIVSTADSLLNAISSNIAQDFQFFKKSSVSFSQKLTIIISVLAIFCSLYFDRIVDLLVLSYELSVCCLFVPIFVALFKSSGNKISAFLAIIGGGIGFIFFRFMEIDFSKEILSLIISSLGFMVGEMFTFVKNNREHKDKRVVIES